ncbi:MAG: hypothetical protein MJ249_13645 [Kiritimatiellae bacterium]|nr:hypothetical protein [Kiritimatiellia bacterium]
MTEADRHALTRLLGGEKSARATTDDLQGLLLQVVFALLMIFMIAYFIFVANQKKERVEEVMALNRQKLTLALDKVAEDHRVRYGLNALMTQGTDGKRTFEPDEFVKGGRLVLAPAAKAAFSAGGKAAFADYADAAKLTETWRESVLTEAALSADKLSSEETAWLDKALATEIENMRLDARGVQRSLAARLQKQWIENPEIFKDVTDAGEIADLLKSKSLKLVSEETGAEVLP